MAKLPHVYGIDAYLPKYSNGSVQQLKARFQRYNSNSSRTFELSGVSHIVTPLTLNSHGLAPLIAIFAGMLRDSVAYRESNSTRLSHIRWENHREWKRMNSTVFGPKWEWEIEMRRVWMKTHTVPMPGNRWSVESVAEYRPISTPMIGSCKPKRWCHTLRKGNGHVGHTRTESERIWCLQRRDRGGGVCILHKLVGNATLPTHTNILMYVNLSVARPAPTGQQHRVLFVSVLVFCIV